MLVLRKHKCSVCSAPVICLIQETLTIPLVIIIVMIVSCGLFFLAMDSGLIAQLSIPFAS